MLQLKHHSKCGIKTEQNRLTSRVISHCLIPCIIVMAPRAAKAECVAPVHDVLNHSIINIYTGT